MFPPRTIRSIAICTLVSGLLAITTSAAADVCTPNLPDGATTSCQPAATTPRQDLRSPDARDAANAEQIARMKESYYESLNRSQPVASPASPAPADESPWLLISVVAGGLALVLASTALITRRRRVAI